MTAILKKELKAYFTSIIGYVFAGVFVLITAFYFGLSNIDSLSPYYSNTMGETLIVFVFLVPVITMRLFAEEARLKTDQLLYTSPLTVTQIVLGKFFAAFLLFAASLAITLLFPFILSRYGQLPVAEVVSATLGYCLLGACFVSIGIFVSSLTESQMFAVVVSIFSIFVFFLLDSIAAKTPVSALSATVTIATITALVSFLAYDSTKKVLAIVPFVAVGAITRLVFFLTNDTLIYDLAYKILKWFSLLSRFSNFGMGILKVADIVYYLTFIALFLFLTVNTIEKRRWK